MTYLAQEDQTRTRWSDQVTGNGKGRTSALNVIGLANGSIVTALSGTHH